MTLLHTLSSHRSELQPAQNWVSLEPFRLQGKYGLQTTNQSMKVNLLPDPLFDPHLLLPPKVLG